MVTAGTEFHCIPLSSLKSLWFILSLFKEREIEQLLDPSKSEELRRTLADRKPDTGAVSNFSVFK